MEKIGEWFLVYNKVIGKWRYLGNRKVAILGKWTVWKQGLTKQITSQYAVEENEKFVEKIPPWYIVVSFIFNIIFKYQVLEVENCIVLWHSCLGQYTIITQNIRTQ